MEMCNHSDGNKPESVAISEGTVEKGTKMKGNEQLKQMLPGLTDEMPECFKRIAELLDYGAFELCEQHGKDGATQYVIPYILNDAVECYLEVQDASLQGEYVEDIPVTSAELLTESARYGLVMHQGEENVCTLWFRNLREHTACFRYHEIGHFWMKGQEQWRQLVYMIGTIADKYRYMGEKYCNKTECELQSLIYFSPFRDWSPIEDPLAWHFPLREEGLDAMERVALEVGDTMYAQMVRLYRLFPTKQLEKILSKALRSPKREAIYHYLYEQVMKASKPYPARDYGKQMNASMQHARHEVEKELLRRGYTGHYPEYTKKNAYVVVTEEHPFTLLEWEDYTFHQQLMISKNPGRKPRRNAGFFRGIGRSGRIVEWEDFRKELKK